MEITKNGLITIINSDEFRFTRVGDKAQFKFKGRVRSRRELRVMVRQLVAALGADNIKGLSHDHE